MREEIEERGLAGAVRSEDRRVLTGADGQREAIENADAALDDRCIGQFEERRPSLQPRVSCP